MILPIITYPNTILETQSKAVNFPLSIEDQDLINNMWETVNHQGVGLAAPQVSVNKQICIINMKEDAELAKEYKIPNFVMINPKIINFSQVQSYMIEGCLSFPAQYYFLSRPANIAVQYSNENGKTVILKAKGWLSRIIQHEIDHLNGVLYINHPSAKRVKQEDLEAKIEDSN